MKKSFRPAKVNRPISKPSISRPNVSSGHGSSIKSPFRQAQKGGMDSNQSFGGTPGGFDKGPSFKTGKTGLRSNRSTPLITLLVLFVCCLVVACIAGAYYLITQGLISLPSFG